MKGSNKKLNGQIHEQTHKPLIERRIKMIIINNGTEIETLGDMFYIGNDTETQGTCYDGLGSKAVDKFLEWESRINEIIKEAQEFALELNKRNDIVKVS